MYSYRDANLTRGLKRYGVKSALGAFPRLAYPAGTMPAGLNRYRTRQDMHLKCRWRAALYADILDAAHVAGYSPG